MQSKMSLAVYVEGVEIHRYLNQFNHPLMLYNLFMFVLATGVVLCRSLYRCIEHSVCNRKEVVGSSPTRCVLFSKRTHRCCPRKVETSCVNIYEHMYTLRQK